MNSENMDIKKIAFTSVVILAFILSIGLSIYSHKIKTTGSASISSNVPMQEEQEPTKKPSEYKVGIPFENAMRSEKPALVLFYADWCHFCVKFMPTYVKLFNDFKAEYNFAKINVEDPKYKEVVEEYQIGGFPTVYLVNPKSNNKQVLSNSDFGDYAKLKKQLKEFLK